MDYADMNNKQLTKEYDRLFTEITNQLGDSGLLSDFEEVVIELQNREKQNK